MWILEYRGRALLSGSVSGSSSVESIEAFASAFTAEAFLAALPQDQATAVAGVFAAYGCELTPVTSDPSWISDGPRVSYPHPPPATTTHDDLVRSAAIRLTYLRWATGRLPTHRRPARGPSGAAQAPRAIHLHVPR